MAEYGAVAMVVIVIAWFYAWTVNPEGNQPVLTRGGQGYYNLLASGFLKGQTALDTPVDPALALLKNPYSPTERAGRGLHDASYYRGRYFIYFGVTPAVVAFVPVNVLTGSFLEERFAIAGFAMAGFFLSVLLIMDVRRRCFAQAPSWTVVMGAMMLGLATMVPALLRRPSIWEVPISAGYTGFMLTLICTWRATRAVRSRWIWLAAASAAMGLTVGARPTYLPAAVVLLVPLVTRLRSWRGREWRLLAVAALGPIAAAGVALAAYNFIRFGSVMEFGQTYQMAGDDIQGLKLFSLGYMAYNFRIYVLSAAGLSPFFPFITVIDPPPGPVGHLGMEDPYGLLPCMPWVVLLTAIFVTANGRTHLKQVHVWALGTFAAAMATMGFVFGFAGACGRYMVDFTPALILLASVGALAVTTWARGVWRVWLGGLVGVLALWSAGFGVLASLQHNALLEAEYPAVYRKLAHAANGPGHRLDVWRKKKYGPVEMDLIFPRGKAGQVEPLVVTGRTFRSDYVYVHYLGDDLVRFGYEHTAYGGTVGESLRIVPGATQHLHIEMGSLYPPAAHPYYDDMPVARARQNQRTIRVTLNGRPALYRKTELFDAVSQRPDIGTAAGRVAFKQPFSGKILATKIAPDAELSVSEYGPVLITLTLPPFTAVRSEPLVCSGEMGRGDLVYVKYTGPKTAVFGYDHWGVGGFEGPTTTIEPGKQVDLMVDYGALHAGGLAASGRVHVLMDNATVLDGVAGFHGCEPDTVVVGANPIGASTAGLAFTGKILEQHRLKP